MAETSTIEWTDATWNPITGCSVVSPGCTNCYAMGLAGTRLKHHPSRAGLTVDTKAGPVWNGQVRLNEEWLAQPIEWKRPRRIFVCAHGDLFAENVPDAWIDRVFAVMALAPHHTFQVLTKRSARMRAYCADPETPVRVALLRALADRKPGEAAPIYVQVHPPTELSRWPLKHVWLGISAEDQRRANERVPDLLATPAAVRFVSAEPLLGPIDFSSIDVDGDSYVTPLTAHSAEELSEEWGEPSPAQPRLDWIIVGGESGRNARPMYASWVRPIRDACEAAGVAFFLKQWGMWAPAITDGEGFVRQDLPDDEFGAKVHARLNTLACREGMARVGKKLAGRLLDGVEHNGMPEVRHG